MNITIVSLNFSPEDTAIGLYSTQMAIHLAKNHRVDVITAYPYYPKWEIFQSYANKSGYIKEKADYDITIHRNKQFVSSEVNFQTRIKLMLTFFYGAIKCIPKVNKPELVIAVIPFTLSALVGVLLKWRYGAKLVLHIQDFEFDAAIQSGIIKNSFLQKILLYSESWLIKKSNMASTISHAMLSKLSFIHPNAIMFPNWISNSLLNYNHVPENQLFDTKTFTILYSGNIGEKQDWDLFLELAKSLEGNPYIKFSVYGNGAKKAWLKSKIKKNPNVSLHDFIPFDELPKLLFSADMHILIQKKDILDTVLPSKLLGMMASGKPSLVVGHKDSEIRGIFDEIGNCYLSSRNCEAISSEIIKIAENEELQKKMGKKARTYVEHNFSENSVLTNFEKDILNAAK